MTSLDTLKKIAILASNPFKLSVLYLTVINQDRCLTPSKITELAESIDEHGLLQPIVVRPIEENMYEIIAGERRFRALQSLHKSQADVIIRHMNDEETAVVALIENIQRENLSAVEEAEAYKSFLKLVAQRKVN